MSFSRSEPGVVVSALVHAAMLAATLIAFTDQPKFEDAQESVPVEVITDKQFNEISLGEKTAPKVLEKPQLQVQKIADTPEPKPRPTEVEAQKDVPTPPPQAKREPDPGDADEKVEKAAPPVPTPPQRTADLTPPTPTPPVKPVPTPPLPEERPTPPPDAEAIEPPKKPEPPQPPRKPEPPKKAEVSPPMPPTPPQRPTPPAKEQKPLDTSAIAKLLEKNPDPKPAAKPKSGDEASESKRMNPSEISRLLSKEPPGQRASTGRELTQTASLGAPTASAARMSPSLWGQLDGMMQEQYKQCWSYLGLGSDQRYVPQIKVAFQQDGSLSGQPSLLNPPSDPALRTLAESALRAVRRCNPLKIPAQFQPYYQQWKDRILRFDPAEMQG